LDTFGKFELKYERETLPKFHLYYTMNKSQLASLQRIFFERISS